jgi:ABC-type glycerol-3-phosphate transport system substrate-binding protein
MKKRTALPMLLALLLLVGTLLSACQPGGSPTATPTTQAPSGTPGAHDFSRRVSITWGYFNGIGEDELYDAISEKFNMDIKLVPIGWNERREQVNTMLAAGDMPDVIFYEMERGQLREMAENAFIKPIPEIDDRFPNLKRLLEQMPEAQAESTYEGRMYAWPKFSGQNPKSKLDTFMYIYRRDWAEQLGMAKPDDIYTIDEAIALARAFVEKDPGSLGPDRTIGIADQDFSSPSLLGAWSLYGNPSTLAYVQNEGAYTWGPFLPVTLEGLKEIQKLYRDGIYWKDFYTAKGYDAHKLYEAGRVGIYYDNFTVLNLHYMRLGFQGANPGTDVYRATTPMFIKGKDGRFWSREFPKYWSYNIYSAKLDDFTMERILLLQDWLAGEEGSRYCWYGLKGVDWTEKDGKLELLWKEDSAGQLVQPTYATMGLRALAMLNTDFDYLNPLIPDQTKKDVEFWATLRTAENTSIVAYDEKVATSIGKNVLRYGNLFIDFQDACKRLIASSTDLEKDYSEWKDEISPKVNRVLAELNE